MQLELVPKCGQRGCEQPAAWRYEWFGKPAATCEHHKPQVLNVADAVGVRLNLQPVRHAK